MTAGPASPGEESGRRDPELGLNESGPEFAARLPLAGNGRMMWDAGHWLAVVSTLETLQDREAVPILGSLLDCGADQELSARIARALVAVNDEASRRILVRALDSPHVMVRIAASGGVLSVYGSAR